MKPVTESVRRLTARPLELVLGELLGLVQRRNGGESVPIPRLTLFLEGGQKLTGEFVHGVLADRSESLLLLHLGDSTSLDVCYVKLGAVQAMILHHQAETLPLVSDGKVKLPPARVPGRLEMDRQLQGMVDHLRRVLGQNFAAAITWDAIPRTEEANGRMGQLLDDLREVLYSIASDELGAVALLPIHRIELRTSAAPGAVASQGTLRILVALDGDDLDVLERKALRQAIETAL